MKKDKMIVVNGCLYGVLLMTCPIEWDTWSKSQRNEYLEGCNKLGRSGRYGNSGLIEVPEIYKTTYELIYA